MSEIKIYVVRPDREEDALQYDVAASTTVGDLKSIIAAESGDDASSFHLVYNQNTLVDPTQSLGSAGVTNGDFLSIVAARNAASSSSTESNVPGITPEMTRQIESFRQRLISDPQLQAQYRQRAPEAVDALQDPARFRNLIISLESARQSQQAAHASEMARLNTDMSPESQAKIEEMIRLERIDAEMEAVMASNPELFGRVTMLYVPVEVNGHPIKAFVDSGAQATIMSADCAERCNITRLIDTRWQGMAKGVGTAKILGRVHRASVKIGFDEVACAFTVMEGKSVDMLLGLDMLKRYQACIDLQENCLRFPGGAKVEFLPEGEIPKMDEDMPQEGQEASSGTLFGTAAAGASKGKDATNFQGAGRTLGNAAAASTSSASAGPSIAKPAAAQTAGTGAASRSQPMQQSQAQPSYPQDHIDALINMGASREQAITLLQRCGGNVELAASTLFDSF